MQMQIDEIAPDRPAPPSKLEAAKISSDFLRGSLAEELTDETASFSTGAESIVKHHGIYQQDDRDRRRAGLREYSFLVRTRLPGGALTGSQLLAELQLCDELGDGTLRITDRQGLQLHGVLKRDLQEVIRRIDATKMTTFGACGDVVRNVMCCPAPLKGSVERAEMRALTDSIARHFALRSRAHYEIWLRDGNQSELVGAPHKDEEPLYGAAYLPRKFKFAFALPDDNCTDALTHDVGFVAMPGTGSKHYFNVYVGGGMGVTPARTDTFPAIAQPLGQVSSDELVSLAHAIVQVYRESGNRSDRKRARFKYLIAAWGLDRFRDMLHQVRGKWLAPPEPIPVIGLEDHLGWHPQEAGHWFLGVRVDNGRIKDGASGNLKTALTTIALKYPIAVRLTPLQDILLCDIAESSRDEIERILSDHGVPLGADIEHSRRLAMACPALPTCGLAITESERAMPAILSELRDLLRGLGLAEERISIRMTGCPNGCARPYVAEIGIVGKAVDRYTLFLGGNIAGTRLAFKFRDMLSIREILDVLSRITASFAATRLPQESFGDFCFRIGAERLARLILPESV
jgi:sulfite reductase (ferredoxin)